MQNSKSKRLNIKNFLSVITKYSLFGFACITFILILSSIFIKASLDHQQRMLRISAITSDQRLVLRELNDTISYLLRISKRPIDTRLVDDVRKDIREQHNTLINNQNELEDSFTKRQFLYYYWPFNLFYEKNQYDMVLFMRNILDDIKPRISLLLSADYAVLETGFNMWDPAFLRTVRQGEHTLTLEQLNKQVYNAAQNQQHKLESLHLYLLILVIISIWIIWLLLLKPLTARTRYMFDEIQQNEKALQHRASHDLLTNLQNRNSLTQLLQHYKEVRLPKMALVAIDVDNFKIINDSYGHGAGDSILKHISSCIQASQIENESAFRSGGDEFLILLTDCDTKQIVEHRLENLLMLINKPLNLNMANTTIHPKLSIGVAYQNGDFNNLDELYVAADIALYHVKRHGGDNYAFYDTVENRKVSQLLQLEADLKQAIENKDFIPYYQPVVNIQKNHIKGFEALARWNHHELGILTPAHWISLAERLGLLSRISTIITEQVLQDQIDIQKLGLKPLTFTINLTEKLLISNELLDTLEEFTQCHSDYHFHIGLEIHESIVLQRNFKQLSEKIASLQQKGYEILIDDFGTGYATINHLLHLPFDYLKTDHTLLRHIEHSKKSQVILKAMHQIAEGLDKALVCEGVETENILNIIKAIGIPYAQGFYFGKPAPIEKTIDMIKAQQNKAL